MGFINVEIVHYHSVFEIRDAMMIAVNGRINVKKSSFIVKPKGFKRLVFYRSDYAQIHIIGFVLARVYLKISPDNR